MNENYKTQFNLLNIPFDESGQLNSQLEPIFPIKDSIYSDLEFSDHIISTQLPEFCKMTFIGNSGAGFFRFFFVLSQ